MTFATFNNWLSPSRKLVTLGLVIVLVVVIWALSTKNNIARTGLLAWLTFP
jgi:hypothetical protein